MEPNEQQPQSDQNKKSNKALPIAIAVVVLLLLGWYFTKGSGNKAMLKSDGEETNTIQTQNNQNSPMSLKELMAGKAQKCEVSYGDQNAETKGMVYVSGGKMRGDFTTQINGKAETSHVINDGKTQYMWTEGSTQMAFKMSLDSLPKNAENSTAQTNKQTLDFEAKNNYNCSSWSENNSEFEVPGNIKFTDYSEMLKSIPTTPAQGETNAGATGSVDVKAMQCAACNSLSGEDQIQCKAALSCK